ncbi:uncharacterized protein BJ212DRAFT_1410870 [Suillus subaureus]|uniref:Uncharacterized protein n=1 Tax=Suillus subaureus TaxID=48587 RepID=A0A9P7ATM9_9AGAM|nr:uncharacterized protein BJ212DRAFT_1410870 [Suillus subaureus]KAG1795274.1 hypothetical protein BJ212DRAFT_1410870 [Suillus subaureus]
MFISCCSSCIRVCILHFVITSSAFVICPQIGVCVALGDKDASTSLIFHLI